MLLLTVLFASTVSKRKKGNVISDFKKKVSDKYDNVVNEIKTWYEKEESRPDRVLRKVKKESKGKVDKLGKETQEKIQHIEKEADKLKHDAKKKSEEVEKQKQKMEKEAESKLNEIPKEALRMEKEAKKIQKMTKSEVKKLSKKAKKEYGEDMNKKIQTEGEKIVDEIGNEINKLKIITDKEEKIKEKIGEKKTLKENPTPTPLCDKDDKLIGHPVKEVMKDIIGTVKEDEIIKDGNVQIIPPCKKEKDL